MMRILVTGVAGYIGSVLAKQLLERGYFVRGVDILNFGGESLLGFYNHPNFEFLRGDIRKKDILKRATENIDAVIHLAAIVGDPACAKYPEIARETNWEASRVLYDFCGSSSKVRRFIFASTCSNYGRTENDEWVDEQSPLAPISLYAMLKVQFERYILQDGRSRRLCTTCLRFATAYGLSTRMRFDLTVNEFTRDAAMGRELVIYGEQFWRPYCHVNDLARACIIVLESEEEKVDGELFGVGDTRENYQKRMIVEEIKKIIPDIKVKFVQKEEDPRNYRVNFNKISNVLGFKITKTVPDGIREIYCAIKDGLFLNPDSVFYRNS